LLCAASVFDDRRFGPAMRAFMAMRARFAEEQLAHARAAGVRQFVIPGAELDIERGR
jgi:O-methyltransferase involved in polyketide biosynthesis